MFGKPKFFDYNHCPGCRQPAPKPNPRLCPNPRCQMPLNPYARR
ncbi:hypothetical protein [Streptomyces sp. NPDC015130]